MSMSINPSIGFNDAPLNIGCSYCNDPLHSMETCTSPKIAYLLCELLWLWNNFEEEYLCMNLMNLFTVDEMNVLLNSNHLRRVNVPPGYCQQSPMPRGWHLSRNEIKTVKKLVRIIEHFKFANSEPWFRFGLPNRDAHQVVKLFLDSERRILLNTQFTFRDRREERMLFYLASEPERRSRLAEYNLRGFQIYEGYINVNVPSNFNSYSYLRRFQSHLPPSHLPQMRAQFDVDVVLISSTAPSTECFICNNQSAACLVDLKCCINQSCSECFDTFYNVKKNALECMFCRAPFSKITVNSDKIKEQLLTVKPPPPAKAESVPRVRLWAKITPPEKCIFVYIFFHIWTKIKEKNWFRFVSLAGDTHTQNATHEYYSPHCQNCIQMLLLLRVAHGNELLQSQGGIFVPRVGLVLRNVWRRIYVQEFVQFVYVERN